MPYENLINQKEGRVVKITFNRPEVMNALNAPMLTETKFAIEEASKDDDVGVIVITGEGKAFSTGADLTFLGDQKLEGGDVGLILNIPARALIKAIQDSPKVVIAMVNGFCLTGALEIALGCDLIVASEEARFGDTHLRWGVRPTWGMSQRLPRSIGILKAKELSFTAAIIKAQEAFDFGLVNMVVPADKLEKTVLELANKILCNSPDAIAAYKYLYREGQKGSLERGLELEVNTVFQIRDTEDRIKQFRKKR